MGERCRWAVVGALALLSLCCEGPRQAREATPVAAGGRRAEYRSFTGTLVGYDARARVLTLRAAQTESAAVKGMEVDLASAGDGGSDLDKEVAGAQEDFFFLYLQCVSRERKQENKNQNDFGKFYFWHD